MSRFVIKKNPDGMKRVRSVAEALAISPADYAGPVLTVLGETHRKQVERNFASEGKSGVQGGWPKLSESYSKKKRKVFGRRKMLVLTGATKARFTGRSSLGYIQRFVSRGTNGAVFQFGANSEIGAAHFYGRPELAAGIKSVESRRIFGGTARRLPVRDMISKTALDIANMQRAFTKWYASRAAAVARNLKAIR